MTKKLEFGIETIKTKQKDGSKMCKAIEICCWLGTVSWGKPQRLCKFFSFFAITFVSFP
jgi:hypothetical protein